MSRYFRRRIAPKPALALLACKLLGTNMMYAGGSWVYHLPRTDKMVQINMHWITEST